MCLVWLIVLALILAMSWFTTIIVVGLICACFGWTFDLAIATGIWLIGCLFAAFFK